MFKYSILHDGFLLMLQYKIPQDGFFLFLSMTHLMLCSEFKVNWDENGMAMFHIACWNVLYRSASARTPERTSIVLTEMEKDMICEAAKTAETHNSYQFIKDEGKRIAELLKQSNHCVAFTGKSL